MALTKELLHILEDQEEPLPKRLKIADNAFKTNKLPIQNREILLLNWVGNLAKNEETSAWPLLLKWLESPQTQELSRNDICLDNLRNLMNVITNGLMVSTQVHKKIIIQCAILVIENRTFQLFYKHDLSNYCLFIAQILNQIDDEQLLSHFLANEQLFNRYLITCEQFPKYFLKHIMISIGNLLDTFTGRNEIFVKLSGVVEKCLFHRNYKLFISYFKMLYGDEKLDKNTSKLPKLIIKNLIESLSATTVPTNIYSIIFHAFCTSYNNNFNLIYKFFIIFNETLGFGMSSYFNIRGLKKFNNTCTIDKSISVLSTLCQVLTEVNIDLNNEVNSISFTEFLKNLTLSVISLIRDPNEIVYKYLESVIAINPLITEQILNDLLIYVMLSNKVTTKVYYEKFLINIFEVFVKLHRIPSLISKMIPTLKLALEDSFTHSQSLINYCAVNEFHKYNYSFLDIMPDRVSDYFGQCITSFASWQVINLFKTLLYHFEKAVNTLEAVPEDSSKFVYLELISSFIAQFLCSVRIAEHTTTVGAVEKFVISIEELRKTLGVFGTTLVKMEHNPTLMKSYLNICYAWGEVYITLAYYATGNEIVLPKTLDVDVTACNITYLHSYLTKDQWRLISQRITNFGEKPCKQIMNKLFIQKLKAMMLFETSVSEDVVTAIKSSILLSVDDNWKEILADRVIMSQIISGTNCKPIAELLLQDTINTKNYNQLSLVYDSSHIVCMILNLCISKISKVFKRYYKSNNLDVKQLLTSKISSNITDELFFNANSSDLNTLHNIFIEEIHKTQEYKEHISNLNDTELSLYIELLKHIPIIQYNNSTIQQVLILFIISVILDLRRNSKDHVCLLNDCESIVIGIAQSYSGSFKVLIEPNTTLQILLNNFERYSDLYNHILQNIFKSEDMFPSLSVGITALTENIKQDKYLNCLLMVLKYINKHKKSKISIEHKELLIEYQETIFKSISQLIQRNKKQPDLTEAYALILRYKLLKPTDDELAVLIPYLEKYIDGICKNKKDSKGSLLLFTTILRNKSKLKVVPEDISLKAWNYCQYLEVDVKKREEFAELVVLIMEHIPNEQFTLIINELHKDAVDKLSKNNFQELNDELGLWNIILSSNLNPIKTQQWQNHLEMLLLQHILPHLSNNHSCENNFYEHIVKFEVNIIQRVQFPLTSLLIDAIFLTISAITTIQVYQFRDTFTNSIVLLQMLLKFRKSQMMDYLPVYLQRYRILLQMLSAKSNADLKLDVAEEQQVSDCAHKLEKLTNNLVACNKHLMRIAPYLVADILKHYEEITLLPNVKLHLNNCLYSLISLCDDHAVSYLMRILSTASTEMFKVIYENYKKYYKFTGRV